MNGKEKDGKIDRWRDGPVERKIDSLMGGVVDEWVNDCVY